MHAIDADRLHPSVAGPVRSLQRRLTVATAASDRASRAVRLLPAMLGGDGPRRYLLKFQNNAEVRSTGGIPGSFAVVEADDGALAHGRQGNAGTVGQANPPLQVTREERAVFGTDLGKVPQDVTTTSDFPRAPQLVRAMWRRSGGEDVDGVLSVDPVALSSLLRGTGPVPVQGGDRITAEDAVPSLLSKLYAEIPEPRLQNVYSDAVATSVFAAVVSGQGEPEVVQRSLVESVRQRRILLWSARPAEQQAIAGTPLAGELPTRATRRPAVGVYLNDRGMSKLDYYLDTRTDVRGRCVGRRQRLSVTVHLRSLLERRAPLPDYVANQRPQLQPDVMRLRPYVYAAVGGRLTSASYAGADEEIGGRTHRGPEVAAVTVDVAPQPRRSIVVTMESGEGQDGPVDLRVAPGVRQDGVGSVEVSGC